MQAGTDPFEVIGEWIDRGVAVAGQVIQADLDVRALKAERDVLLERNRMASANAALANSPPMYLHAAPANSWAGGMGPIDPKYLIAAAGLIAAVVVLKQ